jgi:lia operon protein LiaG
MGKFNIKKLVLGLLAVMLIAYGIGAIITFVSPRASFNGEKNSFDINDTKTSNLNGIKDIRVSVSSTSINIIPTSDNELKAHLNGNVISMGSYSKPDLECYSSGDTLYVNVKNKSGVNFGFFSSSLKLDVYLPSAYSNELKLTSSSGSINVRDLKLTKLQCSASSGSTTIENVTTDNFDYSSSSGSLNANGLITKTSKLTSSSGSKRVSGFTGDLKATSSSGSTRIEYTNFDNNIDINASSGSVEVKLPETAAFYLDAGVSSGSIRSDFPITVTGSNDKHQLKGTVGSDKNKVKINTSSGSIRIAK